VRALGHVPLDEALDRVTEDSDLLPEEKETSLGFDKRTDVARFFTAEAGLARRVLAHPDTRVRRLNVLDDGERAAIDPSDYTGEAIVGVVADLPVGALSIKSRTRKNTQHAAIASDRVFETIDAGEATHE
jgi:hypothetical protein